MKNPSRRRVLLTIITVSIMVVAVCISVGRILQALGVEGVLFFVLGFPTGVAIGGISGRIAARSLWGRP